MNIRDLKFYGNFNNRSLETKIANEKQSINANKNMIEASEKDIEICEFIINQRMIKE